MDADSLHPHQHHDDHRGWVRPDGRRGRWLEPFLLLLIGQQAGYGRALISRLNDLCVAPNGIDVGMAYRTLRELEGDGLMTSEWIADAGAPRRDYRLTPAGRQALDEWVSVMRERGRLVDAFLDQAERLRSVEGG